MIFLLNMPNNIKQIPPNTTSPSITSIPPTKTHIIANKNDKTFISYPFVYRKKCLTGFIQAESRRHNCVEPMQTGKQSIGYLPL